MTEVGILLFDGVTALDVVGPYEVLTRLPDVSMRLLAAVPGPVRCLPGSLGLLADHSLEQCPSPDVLLVPGGRGQEQVMHDQRILAWLCAAHEHTRWTTSVCTGSLILAAAGLLHGRRATTHWLALERLRALGAQPVSQRIVRDGRLMTAAGVSAGIDMALALAAELAGASVAQSIQLAIEYDPQPPFDAGSPQRAPSELRDALSRRSRHRPPLAGR